MSSLSAFKAYDIRGIYPQDIDEWFALRMGRGIGIMMHQSERVSLLIASDVRRANADLITLFVQGVRETHPSVQITNLDLPATSQHPDRSYPYGVASTPVAYRMGQNSYDLGVSVTASHNPKEYVGMKFFDRHVTLIPTDKLKEYFLSVPDNHSHQETSNATPLMTYDIDHLDQLTSFLDQKYSMLSKYHKFVVDYSNGAAITYEQDYLKHLCDTWHRIEHLNTFADGDFPAHHTDTNDAHAYVWLINAIKSSGSEFWIMFDGDADRIGFVTPDGQVIGGDIITAIISKQLLTSTQDKKTVLYDLTSSRIVPETIKAAWWIPVMTRVGRFFINQELNEHNWLFAGEVSGHFLFGEIGWYEMSLLALYYVIKELESYNNINDMIANYTRYYRWPITNLIVEDKAAAINKIKKTYQTQITSEIDGVSVDTGGYWFNVRQSNTEPKLRITCETTWFEAWELAIQEIKNIIME